MQNDPSPRPRGRPRAFDRDAALEVATRLFWQKGYEATSMTDLTGAMGIGAPSLYAAFGSKEALYAEALDFYQRRNAHLTWAGFEAAPTAREAVHRYLRDSAAALGGSEAHPARGCMVTLSSVASEGHEALGRLVCEARAGGLAKLKARLQEAAAAGEIPPTTDLHALARFVQTLQSGMAVLARDGASRAELEAVADLAMAAWDAQVKG